MNRQADRIKRTYPPAESSRALKSLQSRTFRSSPAPGRPGHLEHSLEDVDLLPPADAPATIVQPKRIVDPMSDRHKLQGGPVSDQLVIRRDAMPSHGPNLCDFADLESIRVISNETEKVKEAAKIGTSGPIRRLPYLDRIQKSFGRFDVSGLQAHTDSAAEAGSRAMGAVAFTTGNDVAFAGEPTLRTAAHEAAHAVQQGVAHRLSGVIGQSGDPFEKHADAVADTVVRGQSAEGLLSQVATGSGCSAIQRLQVEAGGQSAEVGKNKRFENLLDVILKNKMSNKFKEMCEQILEAANDEDEDINNLNGGYEVIIMTLPNLNHDIFKSKNGTAVKLAYQLLQNQLPGKVAARQTAAQEETLLAQQQVSMANQFWNDIQASPGNEQFVVQLNFLVANRFVQVKKPHRCFLSQYEKIAGVRDNGKFGLSCRLRPDSRITTPGPSLVAHMHCNKDGTERGVAIKYEAQERLPGGNLPLMTTLLNKLNTFGINGENVEDEVGNFN